MPKRKRPSYEGESLQLAAVALLVVRLLKARHAHAAAELLWAEKVLDDFRVTLSDAMANLTESDVRA